MTAGFHAPVSPFDEVAGNVGAVVPEQRVSEFPNEKVGVRIGLTVTLKVALATHGPCAGSGVNVYTAEV